RALRVGALHNRDAVMLCISSAARHIGALRAAPAERTRGSDKRRVGSARPTNRASRAEQGMFEIIRDPERAAEITAMPLEYYPVDACVLYNDLSTPFFGAGLEVTLVPGLGPVVDRPIEAPGDVDRLRPFDPREAMP